MNELPDILNRALAERLTLTFGDIDEAKSWVFRALKHISRHAPHLRQLMISRRGAVVTVKVPTMHVEGVNNND